MSTVKIRLPLYIIRSRQHRLFFNIFFYLFDERRAFMQWLHLSAYKGPCYLCISCYIYCHLADSPINPQRGGEGRTERNNGCFYTQASKQQLACISRHIGPMFLQKVEHSGGVQPTKIKGQTTPSISHYSVICPETQLVSSLPSSFHV